VQQLYLANKLWKF